MKTYEEKLAEVENIVNVLEDGKMSLAESMKQYETGVGLLKEMEEELKNMTRKLTIIRKQAGGEYTEEDVMGEEK